MSDRRDDNMKITALAPWFGGKRTLAPRIIAELGEHRAYWEPMCGGVSVILQKPRVRQEVLNDLHGDLTNLAVVLSSPRWHEFYQRAVSTLYSEGLFNACKFALAEDSGADCFATDPDQVNGAHLLRAWRYLVVCWMGRNGAAGTTRLNYQFTLRYTVNGGDSATRWRNVIDSIPYWHERLHGVVITRRDAIELIEKIDDQAGVVLYVDPPYIEEGDAYAHRFGDGGMFGDDHARLATALRSMRAARVVVSYYDHPRLVELYPGWTRVSCSGIKSLSAQNRRGVNREAAPEVLLINGPSLTGGGS